MSKPRDDVAFIAVANAFIAGASSFCPGASAFIRREIASIPDGASFIRGDIAGIRDRAIFARNDAPIHRNCEGGLSPFRVRASRGRFREIGLKPRFGGIASVL